MPEEKKETLLEEKVQKKDNNTNKKSLSEKESIISVAWIISGILLLIMVIFISVLLTKGVINIGGKSVIWSQTKVLDKATALEKVSNYINDKILKGQTTAEVKDLETSNGLYKFKVAVQGEEFDSYMTMDGKLLFPSPAVNMEEDQDKEGDNKDNNSNSKEIPKADKATAYLFTMSYCPYGNQAEEAMKPVVELLGDKATIEPHYVIYSNYKGGGSDYCLDEENKYCSMHGIHELNQDVRELCAYKYDGADKYWEFVTLANKNCTAQNVDECWEEQAKQAGLDVERIKTCQTNEALDLLAKEVELNQKYDVKGSPTLIINGTKYSGQRTAEAYKKGICAGFNSEPEECSTELKTENKAANGSCN